MKHITKYHLFEEINPKDISYVESLNDYFTIAFEFEIETDDRSNIQINFEILSDGDVVDDIIEIIKHEMSITINREKIFLENLIYSIINEVENGKMTTEKFFELIDPSKYRGSRQKEIVKFSKEILFSFVWEEDTLYLTEKSKEYLPNFTKKWEDRIDYVGDVTLDRGIEIKPKNYTVGINESIEMINDFYNDMESQSYWKFTDKTGLHINIGVNKESVKWNPIKGILMLNDSSNNRIPFVFKDMTWRLNNNFCGSIISSVKNMHSKDREKLKRSLDLSDIQSLEGHINKFISKKIIQWGFKNFGFNITKISKYNYVEFRYVGGEISKDVLIEKLKYFCFIVYVMTNEEYKRKEYLKKLYKFVDNL